MTTKPTRQPEALKLADVLHEVASLFGFPSALLQSATELRFQHAEIARLTAENEALKAKNQPLLIHVIADMADGLTLWRDGRYVIDDYLAFARAIELAHGIGEKV